MTDGSSHVDDPVPVYPSRVLDTDSVCVSLFHSLFLALVILFVNLTPLICAMSRNLYLCMARRNKESKEQRIRVAYAFVVWLPLSQQTFLNKALTCSGLMRHVSLITPLILSTEYGLLHSFVSYSSPDAPLQGVQVLLKDILSSLHGHSSPPCL